MSRFFTLLLLMVFQLCGADTVLKPGPHRDVKIRAEKDGKSAIEITGTGPHFWSQPLTVPAKHTVLAFEYFSPEGVDSFAVRFRAADGSMTFAGSKPVPLAETWQPFSLELSELPGKESRFHFSLKGKAGESLQIRKFLLRPPNPAEQQERELREKNKAAKQQDAEAFLQYLRTDHPATITKVEVRADTIAISGTTDIPVRLVEIPIHTKSHGKSPFPALRLAKDGKFTFEIQRVVGNRDRAVSRWRMDNLENEISSHCKWPTDYEKEIGNSSLKKLTAKGQKGIGGVPVINSPDHRIFELGVEHATVNVIVNGLLHRTKKPNLKPWKFEGKTYYINERFLQGKDVTIRNLCRNNVIVTCILLVSNSEHSLLKHPEAEARGIYAMPDLTTEAGADHYRAVIHFLAQRYSKPEQRIANWVIHNEIDQAGTWTNMGDQPTARYLETYARSARTVFHTSRLHDPHSRVFVSLTHHWAKESCGHGTHCVKDLVDLWRELAEKEGEFGWGIAYHPYPRNLRNPDTWDDADITYDFSTPYITPRNIEVLPAYLGPDVPILFSEQGFNSPTLSELDQKRQAAGIIYMFRKLPHLPTVEAFHLHRYQDMPDREGGLRLGILDENGIRKLGWFTYSAIGTPEQKKYFAAADEILPEPEAIREIKKAQPAKTAPRK